MNMGKFTAYILICLTLTCLVPVVVSAQDEGRISPLYFGPNALPVPDMLPLFSPRVNLSVWMPVVEFYRNTPASIAHSRPPEVSYSGYQIGNVYVSVDFQVLKEGRFMPDMSVRAAIVTASGDGDEYFRNFDAPGYFFDASIGKSVKFQGDFFQSLRLAANAGFLCWQVNANTQNDAYMYGVKAVLETRLLV